MSAQFVELVAWSAHLLLSDVGHLAAVIRHCWSTLRFDLHNICRHIDDEREEELLLVWLRADGSSELSPELSDSV